jgi:hypothetical protein
MMPPRAPEQCVTFDLTSTRALSNRRRHEESIVRVRNSGGMLLRAA